jgi:signal transduction histidine kinase
VIDGTGLPAPYVYAFAALSGLVVMLLGVLVYALSRFSAAAREARRQVSAERTEGAFVASAMQDALERLRAQERTLQARAEASERLSDTIVAGITSGVLFVDGAGRLRIINPAGRRLLGLVEIPANAPHRDALARADPLVQVIDEGLRSGGPIARRLVTLRVPSFLPDGTTTPVERHLGVTVSPVAEPTGGPPGVICLFTDLTKVVALEEQVRLKESLARLGELTAGLAHEFRNGLATIHGYARLLDPARLEPPYAKYVSALREETEALDEVVTNFLNFARPASFTPAPVDLSLIVTRVRDDFGSEAAKRGGTLMTSGRFGRVDGDDVLLRQALGNLCRNAIEACAEAGTAPELRVEGRIDPATGTQVVSVADNGPGIDPARLDRIFQPFFTTKSSGTGLGLALVQKIVVTHNGRVVAANRAAGGAVFEVHLPLSADGGTPAPPREVS